MSETSTSKYAAQDRYQSKTRKRVPFNLNSNTDQDIIEYLNGLDNVNGYLKKMIRDDMKKEK